MKATAVLLFLALCVYSSHAFTMNITIFITNTECDGEGKSTDFESGTCVETGSSSSIKAACNDDTYTITSYSDDACEDEEEEIEGDLDLCDVDAFGSHVVVCSGCYAEPRLMNHPHSRPMMRPAVAPAIRKPKIFRPNDNVLHSFVSRLRKH